MRVAAGTTVTVPRCQRADLHAPPWLGGAARAVELHSIYGSSMASPDSGILLGTMSGAGATLVAIVGGLLVSRFVTIDSEQRGSQGRLDDVTARRVDAENEMTAATQDYESFRVEDSLDNYDVREIFIAHELDALRRNNAPSPDDTRASPLDPEGIVASVVRAEDLQPDMFDHVVAEISDAARMAVTKLHKVMMDLIELQTQSSDLPAWDELRRTRSLRPNREEVWAQLWDDHLRAEARDIMQRRLTGERRDYVGFAFLAPILPTPRLQTGLLGKRDGGQRLTRRLDAARLSLDRLAAEESLAQRARDSIGTPKGLWLGLVVLVYLAASQLVIPLLFLAPIPATLTRGQSAWLIAVFVSGLLVLLTYLTSYARRLRLRHETKRLAPREDETQARTR